MVQRVPVCAKQEHDVIYLRPRTHTHTHAHTYPEFHTLGNSDENKIRNATVSQHMLPLEFQCQRCIQACGEKTVTSHTRPVPITVRQRLRNRRFDAHPTPPHIGSGVHNLVLPVGPKHVYMLLCAHFMKRHEQSDLASLLVKGCQSLAPGQGSHVRVECRGELCLELAKA